MKKKPFILAIDDDQFYLDEIQMELEGHADFKTFLSPSEFEEKVKKEDLKNVDMIIVDYDFGRGTTVRSGLAQFIRKDLGYNGKLVLCSLHQNFKNDNEAILKEFDSILRKKDFSWSNVAKCLI